MQFNVPLIACNSAYIVAIYLLSCSGIQALSNNFESNNLHFKLIIYAIEDTIELILRIISYLNLILSRTIFMR